VNPIHELTRRSHATRYHITHPIAPSPHHPIVHRGALRRACQCSHLALPTILQFELLQLHVLRSLQAANQPAQATDDYTGLLLMADWVVKHVKVVRKVAITETAKVYSMACATPLPLNEGESSD
jgi:hypothetical protein